MTSGDRPITTAPGLMERLLSAGQRIALATTLDDVLQALIQTAAADPGVDMVNILEVTRHDPPLLTALAAWNRVSGLAASPGSSYALFTGAALNSVSEGETLLVDIADLDNDPRFQEYYSLDLRASGLTFLLVVPIMARQKWAGTLAIGRRSPEPFTLDEIRLYRVLALQSAVMFDLRPAPPDAGNAAERDTAGYFARVVEDAGNCLVTTDLTGIITGFNGAAEMLYGYAAAEVIGQDVSMLIPYSRRSEAKMAAWTVGHEMRIVRMDSERLARDGRVFQAHVAISPIKDSRGIISGVTELAVDITDRVSQQITFQKERDLFEAILETSNDAILMVDTHRQIVTANLQFEAFFRVPRYDLINRPVEALLGQVRARPDLPGELANLLVTFSGDDYQSVAGDFEIMTPEWKVLIWYSAPVHSHEGTIVGRLFVFRDATHERQVDRMKTEFVSLVSHELRTPLTSIKGFTDFMLDTSAGPIPDNIREYLEIVRLNADRLTSLINDILDITRIEAGRVELRRKMYSIGAVLKAVVIALQPQLDERKQTATVHIPDDLPSVWIDVDRMSQVVTNLIENAIKYTLPGGAITVEAYQVNNKQELPDASPANVLTPALIIGIHDTGIGIGDQEQPQIFTRFYRTAQASHRQIAGTGLGLAIVKSFVELHSGQVWFYSKVDHGSSFYFSIPLLEAA